MAHQTYQWKQSAGESIFAQSWISAERPHAILCIIHGQSDHSGRFEQMAHFMADKGMAVYAADLIGHGRSGGKRGHVLNFSQYLETVDALIDLATKAHPQLPVFVYGQSMGGNVVINHAFGSTSSRVKAYIASSPWIRLAFEPPAWKVTLGKTMRSIYPSLSQPTNLNTKHLSRDPAIVSAYENDPLVHGKISASAFAETMLAGIRIPEQAQKLQHPLLIMHGSSDQLISHKASAEFAALRPDLITWHQYDGWYHELHNEPEKEQVFQMIYQFIQKNM